MSDKSGKVIHLHPGFENLIRIATNAKGSWDTINLEEVTETFRSMTMECEANRDYYMRPRFPEVLKSVVAIISGLEEKHGNQDLLSGHHRVILIFLRTIMKDECVRIALRDQYKLFFSLGVFFNPGLLPDDSLLLLRVLETLSRNMIIYWKPPQLTFLMHNVYTYILQNPEHHTLPFQLLINLCLENPSCASIGKLDESSNGIRRTFKGSTSDLSMHLLVLYQALLPVEALGIGNDTLKQATAKTILRYQSQGDADAEAMDGLTFLQLGDMVETIAKKVEPLFTLPVVKQEGDPEIQQTTISDSKETFLRILFEIFEQLETFTVDTNETLKSTVKVDLLKFVLTLLPSYLPLGLSLKLIKDALSITDRLYNTAEKGSPVYHGCISVYLYIVELILSKKEGNKNVVDNVVSGKFFRNVFGKLSLSANVDPSSVELNITSTRLINCLSDSIYGEEGSKKLDLPLLRTLVVALAEPADILPNMKWRRTICLVELLATMSKYSTRTNMLNQLLHFVSSPNVSQEIANCMLNGDEGNVRKAIAVTSATSFAEDAVSSISKSIIKGRYSPSTEEPRGLDSEIQGCSRGDINLCSAMKRFKSFYADPANASPNIDDLLSWYNLKVELHEHELSLANQNVSQLQKTVDHLKFLLKKQFQLVSRQTSEANSEKSEQLLLLKASVSQQKTHNDQISLLQKEVGILTSQLEIQKEKVAELDGVLGTLKGEKEQLLLEFKKEEQLREATVKKLKLIRDEVKVVKSENSRLEKELKDAKGTVASLQDSLKEKEEESIQNKLLYDSERKKVDTIRGVIGSNFGNLNLD